MSIHHLRAALALSLFAAGLSPVEANVALALPFSDHMVLQRRMTVPVWGTASTGEAVTVTFRDQTKTAAAGPDGKWRVDLAASEAGGPFQVKVAGNNTLTLSDVMVGEVWFAGGQSNMEYSLTIIGGPNVDSAKTANIPDLRLMMSASGKKWQACTPDVAANFSATGFYFGRDLQKALQVPVGIISSAINGTDIERWLDPAAIAADPLIANDAAAGTLYRQWVAPSVPLAIKGFIWYQGENNANNPYPAHPDWSTQYYQGRFKALINGWRKAWGEGDIPFHYVQLPNINGLQTNAGDASPWAEIREAQRLSLSIPNTAMTVTIDLGANAGSTEGQLHPYDKWDVGYRLSLPVRALVYGESQLTYAGPMYRSMLIQGKSIKLIFRDAAGLAAKGGAKATGFAIAGADNKWSWADAIISKDTVIVSNAAIASPTKVRYGWGQNPPCNLYNGAGLAASPFQTDGPQLPVDLHRSAEGGSRIAEAPAGDGAAGNVNALGRSLGKKTSAFRFRPTAE